MTDDRPPIDSSDEELVSAYLDGEATPAERVRVEADPQLLALVDAYRSTAEAVGSPVMPLDQPRRDAMVSAALAVLDELDDLGDQVEADGSPAKVIPLSGRRRWISRAPGLAAAAAILFLVGIGLVLSSRGPDQDQQAAVSASAEPSTSADDLKSADAGDAAEDNDAGSATDEAPAAGSDPDQPLAAPSSTVTDLGDFADEASLRQALATDAPETGSAPGGSDGTSGATAEERDFAARVQSEANRCATVVTTTDPLLGELLDVRTATLAGEPVLIFSHGERDEPDRVIDTVTDRGSCQIRFAQAR